MGLLGGLAGCCNGLMVGPVVNARRGGAREERERDKRGNDRNTGNDHCCMLLLAVYWLDGWVEALASDF